MYKVFMYIIQFPYSGNFQFRILLVFPQNSIQKTPKHQYWSDFVKKTWSSSFSADLSSEHNLGSLNFKPKENLFFCFYNNEEVCFQNLKQALLLKAKQQCMKQP
jgi:hypothetical protein